MRRKTNAGVSTPEKATPRRSTRGRGRRSPSKSPEPEPDTDERENDAAQEEEKHSSSEEETTSRKGTGKTRGVRGRSTSSRRKTDDRPPSRTRRNSRREKEQQEDQATTTVPENGAETRELQQQSDDQVDLPATTEVEEVMEPIPEEPSEDTESVPVEGETDAVEVEKKRQDELDGSKEENQAESDNQGRTSESGECLPAGTLSRMVEIEDEASADIAEKVSQNNSEDEEVMKQDDGDKQEKEHSRDNVDDDAHDDSKEVVNNRSRTREESDTNESGNEEEGEIVGKLGDCAADNDEHATEIHEGESKPTESAESTMVAEEDGKKVPSTQQADVGEDHKKKECEQPQPPRRRPRFSSRPDKDLSPVQPTRPTEHNEEELEAGEIQDTDQTISEAAANNSKEAEENNPVKEAPRIRPLQRKRRWLSSKNADSKPAVITISTDSLKNIIADVQPVPLADVKLDSSSEPEGADGSASTEEDESGKQRNRKGSIDSTTRQQATAMRQRGSKSAEKENIQLEGQDGETANGDETVPKQKPAVEKLTITRKISIVSDDGSVVGTTVAATVRPPSPAKHHTSNILYISNLVRPFTVLQLKGLLARTGKIVENGFWIDKIKSKCYVKYETEDEATETRHALHGIRWPVSNPKCLIVDFGSEEAMEKAILSTLEEGTIRATVEGGKEGKEFGWSRDAAKKDEDTPRPVREWDLGKKETLDQERDRNGRGGARDRERESLGEKDKSATDRTGRDRDRGRMEDGAQRDGRINRLDVGAGDRNPEGKRSADGEFGRERRRSTSMSPARKFKKKENEPPIRLLDDLFRKTKATPCIYWLPLTTEQIAVKEEQRRKNMAEHQRRLDEQRKQQEEERERERKRERERRERERERDRDRDRERERDRDRERDRERDRDRDRDRRRSRSRDRSRDDGGRRRHR